MESYYLSLLLFIIAIIIYYTVLKKSPSLNDVADVDLYLGYKQSTYVKAGIFFMIVLLTQFGANVSAIITNCGGSVTKNVSSAAILTFIPWFFIFGIMMGMLIIFPSWKSAFSNVVGYFVVSGQANNVLSELLIDKNIRSSIGAAPEATQSALENAATAIVKLNGNMSLLINQITPDNFKTYWDLLNPLMKTQYKDDSSVAQPLKQQLLDLVMTRDNVGEAMWYLYTAIFLTSFIQYKIATQGCSPDLTTLAVNQQRFQAEQEAIQKENDAARQTVYAHS